MSSGGMNASRSASLRPQSASVGFTKGSKFDAAPSSFDSNTSAYARSAGSPERAQGSRRPLSAAIPHHRASTSGSEYTSTSSIKNDMHLWKFGVPSVPRSPRCFGKPRVSEEKYSHLCTNGEAQTTRGGLSSSTSRSRTEGCSSVVIAAPSSSLGTTSTLPPDDITWRIANSLSPRHPPPKTMVSIERLFGDDHRKKNETTRWHHSSTAAHRGVRKGFDNADDHIVSIHACSTTNCGDETAVFVDIEASHHPRRRLYEEGLKKALGVGIGVGREAEEGDDDHGVQTAAGNIKDLDFLSLYPHLPITRPDTSKLGHPRRLSLLCESKGPTRKGQRALLRVGVGAAYRSQQFTSGVTYREEAEAHSPAKDPELCMRANGGDDRDKIVGEHDRTSIAMNSPKSHKDSSQTSSRESVEVGKPNEIDQNANATLDGIEDIGTEDSSLHECTTLHAVTANDPDLGEGLINGQDAPSLSPRQRDFGGGIPRRPTSAFGAMYRPWSRLQLEADAASASVGLQSAGSSQVPSSMEAAKSSLQGGAKKRITFPDENPHPSRSKYGCVVLTDEADELADADEGTTQGGGKGGVGSEDDERAQWTRTLAGSQLAALTAANGATQMDQYRRNNWKKRKQSSPQQGSNGNGGNASSSSPTSPLTLADLQQQALPFTVSPTQRRGKIVMLDDRVGGLIYEEESANIIPFSLEGYGRKGGRRASTAKSSSPSSFSAATIGSSLLPPSGDAIPTSNSLKVSDYVYYYTRTDKGSGAVRAVWLSPATEATVVSRDKAIVETAAGRTTPRSLELLTSSLSQERAALAVTGNSERGHMIAHVESQPPNSSSSLSKLAMANVATSTTPITGVGVAAQSLTPREGSGAASLEYFGLYQKYLREIMADAESNSGSGGGGEGGGGVPPPSVAAATKRLQAEESAHRIFAPRPPPSHQSLVTLNQKPLATKQETRKEDRLSYALAKALLEDDKEAVVGIRHDALVTTASAAQGHLRGIVHVGDDGAGSAREGVGTAVPLPLPNSSVSTTKTTAITAAYYKRPDGSPRSVFDQLGGPLRRPRTAAEIQKKIADEKNAVAGCSSSPSSNTCKETLDRKQGGRIHEKGKGGNQTPTHTSRGERKASYGTEWYTSPREWSRKR